MKKDDEIDFATTNLNTLVDRKKGECKTCKEEEGEICEHKNCQTCLCEHYCWLD